MAAVARNIRGLLHYSVIEPVREEPRLLLLALSVTFITLGQGIVVPILPLLVRSFGMTAAMVGIAVSAFGLARVFANIPAGFLTRQQGFRFVMILGAFFAGTGNLLIGLIPSYGPLIAFRLIAGLGSAMFITAAVAFVAEVSTPANRGRFMTIYQTGFLLGTSMGPSVGGITAAIFGLSGPFFLVAGLSVVAAYWTLTKIPGHLGKFSGDEKVPRAQAENRSQSQSSSILSLFFTPAFIAVNLIALGIFFTRGGALFNLWPLMMKEHFLLDPGRLGLIMTVPSAVNLMCTPFAGGLADRWGRRVMLIPSTFLFAAAALVSSVSPNLWIFAIAMICYGVGQAIESPSANAYVSDLAPRDQRAVALAIHRTFGDIGLVAGSPLLGLIADGSGIPWALVVNAGIVAIPGLVFLVVGKETARRQPQPQAASAVRR